MSHILKALDRAAADREQGEAPPAFVAPPVPPPVYDDEDGERRWSPARWTFVAALVILSSAATWSFMRRGMPEVAEPTAADPVVAAATQAPAAPMAPAPAAPSATPSTAAPAAASPPPRMAVPVVVGPSAPSSAASSAPSPAAPRAAQPREKQPIRIFAPNHVYTRDELPDVARAHLPALNVGMAVYAEAPAKRRVYIGGKPYREGQMVAPGLRLEEIGKREMRLRYGAYRLRVPY